MLADRLQAHITIVARSADPELVRIACTVQHAFEVEGRSELEVLVGRLLAADMPVTPKTLDLVGHTTAEESLLALGEWVIDATSPTVSAFFRELQDQDVLARLGIHAVRLLGCSTATTARGRWTICRLADILGVEVLGTTGPVLASYYDESGFAAERRYLLASSRDLTATTFDPKLFEGGDVRTPGLDLDRLPSVTLDGPHAWPVRMADRDDARALLRLVRRFNGSIAPTLQATPSCEIAFPAATPCRYHTLQVLFGGEIIRVDHGVDGALIYPVDHPDELRRIIGRLHLAHSERRA